MYYLPSSCMFLFFLFFLFHHLPSSSCKEEPGWCKAKFQCGNITAGFPFSGANRPLICGHPSLELHCFNNKASIIISDHLYNVLHIDEKSNTLRLARAELEGSFCEATFTSTTLPSELFQLSSTYKSLTVFYLCDSSLSYSSYYTCPGRGLVSVSENLDYQNSCQASFPVNVPKSFVLEEKELNLTHLEKALKEGFEVKLKTDEKACQECSSSGGTCGFQNSTQICCKESSPLSCYKLHSLNGLPTAGTKAGILVGSVSGLAILTLACLVCFIRRRRKTSNYPRKKILDDSRQQYLKALIPLKHYSYVQIKKITKSFAEVVGKGGFGTVYKGILCDGRSVAVKILKDLILMYLFPPPSTMSTLILTHTKHQATNLTISLKSKPNPNDRITQKCLCKNSSFSLLIAAPSRRVQRVVQSSTSAVVKRCVCY